MTNAERQAAYRARQGWAGRRKDRDRKREARKKPVSVMSVTIAPPVRYEKREVQETEYVSMDEVEGDADVMREHREVMEKHRPPAPVSRQMEPEGRVVAYEASENELKAMEDLITLVAKKRDRPAGDVMSGTGIEVEM